MHSPSKQLLLFAEQSSQIPSCSLFIGDTKKQDDKEKNIISDKEIQNQKSTSTFQPFEHESDSLTQSSHFSDENCKEIERLDIQLDEQANENEKNLDFTKEKLSQLRENILEKKEGIEYPNSLTELQINFKSVLDFSGITKQIVENIASEMIRLTLEKQKKSLNSLNKQFQNSVMNYFLECYVSQLILNDNDSEFKRDVFKKIVIKMEGNEGSHLKRRYITLLNYFLDEIQERGKVSQYINLLLNIIHSITVTDINSSGYQTSYRKKMTAILLLEHALHSNRKFKFPDFYSLWTYVFSNHPLGRKKNKSTHSLHKILNPAVTIFPIEAVQLPSQIKFTSHIEVTASCCPLTRIKKTKIKINNRDKAKTGLSNRTSSSTIDLKIQHIEEEASSKSFENNQSIQKIPSINLMITEAKNQINHQLSPQNNSASKQNQKEESPNLKRRNEQILQVEKIQQKQSTSKIDQSYEDMKQLYPPQLNKKQKILPEVVNLDQNTQQQQQTEILLGNQLLFSPELSLGFRQIQNSMIQNNQIFPMKISQPLIQQYPYQNQLWQIQSQIPTIYPQQFYPFQQFSNSFIYPIQLNSLPAFSPIPTFQQLDIKQIQQTQGVIHSQRYP